MQTEKYTKIFGGNQISYIKQEETNDEDTNKRIDELRRKYYQAINKLKDCYQPKVLVLKDDQGRMLGEKNDIFERWI